MQAYISEHPSAGLLYDIITEENFLIALSRQEDNDPDAPGSLSEDIIPYSVLPFLKSGMLINSPSEMLDQLITHLSSTYSFDLDVMDYVFLADSYGVIVVITSVEIVNEFQS